MKLFSIGMLVGLVVGGGGVGVLTYNYAQKVKAQIQAAANAVKAGVDAAKKA